MDFVQHQSTLRPDPGAFFAVFEVLYEYVESLAFRTREASTRLAPQASSSHMPPANPGCSVLAAWVVGPAVWRHFAVFRHL